MNRILIIRFSSLGDVVLATAVVDALKRLWAGSELTFVVKDEYTAVLEQNPQVERVIAVGTRERGLGSILRLGSRLKDERFDLVVDLQGGPRGRALASRIGAPHVVRPRSRRLRRMLMAAYPRVWRKWLPHVLERYLECLEPWGDGGPPAGQPVVWLTPEERSRALAVAERVEGSALVALAPGAKWPAKEWPRRFFSQLGEMLVGEGAGVLILGSQQEQALIEEVASAISQREHAMAVAGELRLLAALFAISAASVCNDSGLMHLAAAVETPTVALFGPTAPHLGFTPVGDRHRTLWLGLECSPCSLHGEKKCRKAREAPCMNRIEPEQVLAVLRPLLGSPALEGAGQGQAAHSETSGRNR